ncbi:type 4b pilus protein PilO2 [Photorhabdus sp. RM71S]|uniref:type 4b pilus protein PilO2 n=1 Tax=Photorhabdus sp. RM71S TaxID=3342824 RepID=UPI0036DCA361
MEDTTQTFNGAIRLPVSPNQNWLAALQWEITPAPSKAQLRRRVAQEHATHFLTTRLSDNDLLACWTQLPKSEKKAPVSAALAVAHQLEDNCYAIFELQPDQFWFIATCKGQLSVLSDKVGNRESTYRAIDFFLTMNNGVHSWKVIAPEGFFEDSRDSHPKPLVDFILLSGAAKRYALPAISLRRPILQYSMLTLAVVVAFTGRHFYQAWQEDQVLKTRQQQLKQSAAVQPKPLPPPWPSQPDVRAIIQGNNEHTIPLSVAGWMFESKTYTRQRDMELVYRRTGNASVVDFKRRIQVLFGDNSQVQFNIPGGADQATVILPVTSLPGSRQQTVLGLTEAMMTLTTFAQRQNAQLQLDPQPASQLINGEEVTTGWREVRFTLILPISPDIYIDSLPMPGLRIASIRTVREDVRLSYTLEGTLYVNP